MWRDAALVAGKDLRIELRSRVVLNQVAPFALIVLVLFAFALGPDPAPMLQAAAGLFWVAVLFCGLLAVQRSYAVESAEGTRDGLRLSGVDPSGTFLGKASAVALQLIALEVVLTIGVVLLYGAHVRSWPALVASAVAGTVGLAAVGTLYGISRQRPTGTRDAAAVAAPARRGAGASGRHTRLAVRARHRPGIGHNDCREQCVDLAVDRVRSGVSGPRGHGVRTTAGGGVNTPVPAVRGTMTVRVIGVLALVSVACTVWLGLWVTPPDKVQGNLVRLVYVHPPIAWVALYCAFGLAAISSVLWLWPRTRSRFWDRLAVSSMEVGTVFTALTLITGSIWGRPTWGVWWAWDARLTSTALLLVLQLGYLTLRQVPGDADARARRCAVAALIAAVDVPIVHFSVDWWNTLHQKATVLNTDLSPTIHGAMAWTLLLGFVAFTLAFVWMLLMRYRVETLQRSTGGDRAQFRPEGAVGRRGWTRERGGQRRASPRRGDAVKYIDAGYSVALAVLASYSVLLVRRRRRLERIARAQQPADAMTNQPPAASIVADRVRRGRVRPCGVARFASGTERDIGGAPSRVHADWWWPWLCWWAHSRSWRSRAWAGRSTISKPSTRRSPTKRRWEPRHCVSKV